MIAPPVLIPEASNARFEVSNYLSEKPYLPEVVALIGEFEHLLTLLCKYYITLKYSSLIANCAIATRLSGICSDKCIANSLIANRERYHKFLTHGCPPHHMN